MTLESGAPAGTAVLSEIDRSLGAALPRLEGAVSDADVLEAQRVIERVESSLGRLVVDPWDPASKPLREVRDILGSHLLAAAACIGADVSTPITAGVLRRGVDAARATLASGRAVHAARVRANSG